MTTWITTCDTCKRDDWEARAPDTSDGETLADLIEAAATDIAGIRTRRHSCLMGCARGCNVTIQAANKLTYTVGEFEPNLEAALAVVQYATLHSDSASGQVPYRQWPQAIKGHFITRHPPLPDDDHTND